MRSIGFASVFEGIFRPVGVDSGAGWYPCSLRRKGKVSGALASVSFMRWCRVQVNFMLINTHLLFYDGRKKKSGGGGVVTEVACNPVECCNVCGRGFPSRSQLFKHLRGSGGRGCPASTQTPPAEPQVDPKEQTTLSLTPADARPGPKSRAMAKELSRSAVVSTPGLPLATENPVLTCLLW